MYILNIFKKKKNKKQHVNAFCQSKKKILHTLYILKMYSKERSDTSYCKKSYISKGHVQVLYIVELSICRTLVSWSNSSPVISRYLSSVSVVLSRRESWTPTGCNSTSSQINHRRKPISYFSWVD